MSAGLPGEPGGGERTGAAPLARRLEELIGGSAHNLVSAGDRARIAGEHVPECAGVAALLPVATGARWLDLGTGGGLPGLVCAWHWPQAQWVLLDSTAKKVAEVERFARELDLNNVLVVQGRAETVAWDPTHREGYAGVVARGVGSLPVLAELARGFVGDGGYLVAVKGAGWAAEVAAAHSARQRLGWGEPEGLCVTSAPRPAWLVTMRAHGPPPEGFPRRPGVPQRRPL